MDIGTEKETEIIEPIESPVPQKEPSEPEEVRETEEVPVPA